MKKTCFIENQIISILKELDAGFPVVELSRKQGGVLQLSTNGAQICKGMSMT